ncbi:MAG TPA: NADP-dependent oxidoreductase [Cryomorphaceae bacterium]|nr:NADP-dependent oxidoreductase [Cryomorphaceae bacterium]
MSNTQENMRAVAIEEFGGTDKLKVVKFKKPEIADDQILLRTHFAGVGVWDSGEREGIFAEMMDKEPEFPKILGTEGSGIVEKAGKGQDKFSEGDRVYGQLMPKEHDNGFYAEYSVLKTNEAWRIPENLDLEQASVLTVDGGTALRGLRDTLKIQQGESLMVFGASGGLGHLAIQIAKKMGAKVFAVASGKDGVELARNLGADAAVNGKEDDVLSAARDFAPDGIDAAILATGGEKAQEALKALKSDGRVAYPMGVEPEPEAINDLQIDSYNGKIEDELIQSLNKLVESGTFKVHIGKTYSMDEIAKAQEKVSDHLLGRMNLKIKE